MSSSKRPGMAKNEDAVERLADETRVTAERVHYTGRLVGLHEPAAPLAGPPADHGDATSPDAAHAGATEPMLTCPKCGTTNPAVMNRSDGAQCYRCDRCGHQWGDAGSAASSDTELPPVPAIDAQGG